MCNITTKRLSNKNYYHIIMVQCIERNSERASLVWWLQSMQNILVWIQLDGLSHSLSGIMHFSLKIGLSVSPWFDPFVTDIGLQQNRGISLVLIFTSTRFLCPVTQSGDWWKKHPMPQLWLCLPLWTAWENSLRETLCFASILYGIYMRFYTTQL